MKTAIHRQIPSPAPVPRPHTVVRSARTTVRTGSIHWQAPKGACQHQLITRKSSGLLCFQEGAQVVYLVLCQTNLESSVVEVDQHLDVLCCACMEVRRASSQTTQYGWLELTSISNVASDHSSPWIGG